MIKQLCKKNSEVCMSADTKIPRRRLDQVICSLINAVGGYKVVAAACLVTTDSVNKWKQDPEGDGRGQDIPVKHLQTLLAIAGQQLGNFEAQFAVEELLNEHFLLLCHRRSYLEDKVFAIIETLTGNGKEKAA